MTLSDFIKGMHTSCEFLEKENYQLREIDTSINRNFWFERQGINEGFRISFGWTQYNDNFHVSGLAALKRFEQIERKIQGVKGGDLNDYYTIYHQKIDYVPTELDFVRSGNNLDFVLRDSEDINAFSKVLRSFYQQSCSEFIERFKTLQDVNEWLKQSDSTVHKDLIVSWSNSMMVRKLLIMKSTNDEKFSDLYSRYRDFLSKKNSENESPYVDMFSFFMKIDPYLKSSEN